MHNLKAVINFQIERVANNILTFLLITATLIAILSIGYNDHALKQAIAYLFVMWLSSFFIDLFAIIRPINNDFTV